MLDIVLILLMIWFGSRALGTRFRLYSLATLLIILVSGGLMGFDSARLGVWQRANIVAFLTWTVVLAVALMSPRADGRDEQSTIATGRHQAEPELSRSGPATRR